MPAKGFRKRDRHDVRVKVGLTVDQATELTRRAKAARMSQANYLRALFEHDIGERKDKPSVNRRHETLVLAGEAHLLAMQLKKIGANFNQFVRQANTGMVPITRQEVVTINTLIEVGIAKATAVFERILAR